MLVIDQAVKAWARHTFGDNLSALGGKPFPGFFELTLTYNDGIAFGMFQRHGVLLAPIAIGMSAAAIWYVVTHKREPLIVHLAMAFLTAGALGNLYDRLVLHKVTDMFYFRAINFPVFNVADACITVAACLLIVTWGLDALRRPESAPAVAADGPTS